jgi:hypothetical protein
MSKNEMAYPYTRVSFDELSLYSLFLIFVKRFGYVVYYRFRIGGFGCVVVREIARRLYLALNAWRP